MKKRSGFRLTLFLALALAGCGGAVGYGIKVGMVDDNTCHSGFSYDEILDAARDALAELGAVTLDDREQGLVQGEIPPFRVEARLKRGSCWLKLVGVEEERGKWTRKAGKGEWTLDLDGKLVYRRGAETLEGAVEEWSEAVNRRL